MSSLDIDFNLEAEIAGIRGGREHREKPRPQPIPTKPIPTQPKPEKPQIQHKQGGGGTQSSETSTQPALKHSHEHAGGESAPTSVPDSVNQKKSAHATTPVDWKRFKTMPGIFEHVGGDRPVRLHPSIKKSQVSGIPEPMLVATQKRLMEKHIGAVVGFPWGEFEITDKNRVFTTKSSLLRYLLFDSFRDADGTHLQYAKQWMVLQHPVFDPRFNPETHLGQGSDELDIYALLFVAHTSEEYVESAPNVISSEQDFQTVEQLGMLNMGLGRVLDKLNEQEKLMRAHIERSTLTETVLLLDRMGLLVGGLPRDVDEFVRVLEQNRDAIHATDTIVGGHIEAEKERKKTLQRQERMRQMQMQQRQH